METCRNDSNAPHRGAIIVTVVDGYGIHAAVTNAKMSLYTVSDLTDTAVFNAASWKPRSKDLVSTKRTNNQGKVTFDGLEESCYVVAYGHYPVTSPQCVCVRSGCVEDVCFELELNLQVMATFLDRDCKPIPCVRPRVGDNIEIEITGNNLQKAVITPPQGFKRDPANPRLFSGSVLKTGNQTYLSIASFPEIGTSADAGGEAKVQILLETDADEAPTMRIGGNVGASLTRTETEPTDDLPLWVLIRNSTEALSFNNYLRFMDLLFCGKDDRANLKAFERERFTGKRERYTDLRNNKRFLPFSDADAYRVVKAATEAFVMVNCGVLRAPQPFTVQGDRDLDEAYLDAETCRFQCKASSKCSTRIILSL